MNMDQTGNLFYFSFPNSQIRNVFVDHVANIGVAMAEGRQEFQGHTDTELTRVLMVITDKVLNDTVKCKFCHLDCVECTNLHAFIPGIFNLNILIHDVKELMFDLCTVIYLSLSALLSTEATLSKDDGIVVAVVDALETNDLAHVASNSKLSFTTSQFDILPYILVIQRSLCIGKYWELSVMPIHSNTNMQFDRVSMQTS